MEPRIEFVEPDQHHLRSSLSVAVAVTGNLIGSSSGFRSIEFRPISSVFFRQQESRTLLVNLIGYSHFLNSINQSVLPITLLEILSLRFIKKCIRILSKIHDHENILK